MSSPFQRIFSAKTPFRHNHGDETSRQFGGYDKETGEVINAITGRTPSQQDAINNAMEQRRVQYADEYAAYNDARNAYKVWNEKDNQFGFGGLDYPQQAELDSVTDVWHKIKNQPVETKPKIEVDKLVKPADESVDPTKQ